MPSTFFHAPSFIGVKAARAVVPGIEYGLGHSHIIHMDVLEMASMRQVNVRGLCPGKAETEKITINLGFIDLGHVDLLVQEGFYSNRTDFIRTAIRNQIDRHADIIKSSVVRKTLDLGLRHYNRADLEAVRSAGQTLHLNVLGLLTIAPDVSAELARTSIASITVLGALHASPQVKEALADRIC
jgi:Arc/MetJ-type ribon-helix-helix transcriptional regulator